ncbi:hypothetical protein BC829DRAFT_383312 [Chytridium lagenaria]|nr:hypothetical protein BC829DRAFT_383312 [Chytridium lagenaria]
MGGRVTVVLLVVEVDVAFVLTADVLRVVAVKVDDLATEEEDKVREVDALVTDLLVATVDALYVEVLRDEFFAVLDELFEELVDKSQVVERAVVLLEDIEDECL